MSYPGPKAVWTRSNGGSNPPSIPMKINSSSPEPSRRYEGRYGNISGFDVLLGFTGEKLEVVDVSSVLIAIGEGIEHLKGYLEAYAFSAELTVGETRQLLRVIALGEFFKFCMMHPSPKLDAFREQLAVIARSVQDRGSYIDVGAGPKAFIPAGMENDEWSVMLATMQFNRMQSQLHAKQIQEHSQQINIIDAKVKAIEHAVGRGPESWTVAAWLRHHDVDFTTSVAQAEGIRLKEICKRRGIVVSATKVCNGGSFPARQWPRKAIAEWWPDFCKRHDLALIWNA